MDTELGNLKKYRKFSRFGKSLAGLFGLFCLWLLPGTGLTQALGVDTKTITLGSLLPLEGDLKGDGLAIKTGLEAAFATQTVQGRRIELKALNDFYEPNKAVEGAKQLAEQGVFLMIGNYGTPTLKAVLPVLAPKKIPVLAPYTGAALTSPGEVLNMRASYEQEVHSVIEIALRAGIKPEEICAYVQNDSYGMANLAGIRSALAAISPVPAIVAKLDQIINQPGDQPKRDNLGPVGVYNRGLLAARDGYLSLKAWEETSKHRCRLVVTAGVFEALANFIHYARTKGETWVFSVNSFSGTPLKGLKDQNVTGKVIQTQVVPPLDATQPIVEEARKALGAKLNHHAVLEGYLTGKLFLAIAQAVEGPLTQENFLKAARRQPYDLGGFKVDFTNGRNPGSEVVFLSYLKDDAAFVSAKPGDLEALLK